MSVLRIRTWGDPVLKTRAKEVTEITDEVRQLARDMLETLQSERGVGLAANQVGALWRVFVAEVKEGETTLPRRYTILNPKLTRSSRETETAEEGCLSFPGLYGPVERSCEITIEGLDLKGRPVTLQASGLLARACQHELDHLDGVVFIERMKLVQRLMLNRQLNELARHTQATLAGRGTPRI